MNRELLEKPFGPEQIKQREGNFGRMLEYVEAHTVIQRLNDAFDARWSFEIVEQKIMEQTDEVVVWGKLNADNVIKSQFGSSRITRNRENGEMVSLADDLKAAATDALKKCATMLGVGLHLYSGINKTNQHSSNGHYQRKSHAAGGNGNHSNQHKNGNGGNKSNGNGNGSLTEKQYRYILQLNEGQGGTNADLDRQCEEMFGTAVQYLSKSDASSFIENLLSR
jgi:hypothetical protein